MALMSYSRIECPSSMPVSFSLIEGCEGGARGAGSVLGSGPESFAPSLSPSPCLSAGAAFED